MLVRLGLFLMILMLTGCEPPEVFGVPQSTWNTLTPEQKQQVIQGYNQRKQIETENAPLQNAINTAGSILGNPATFHPAQTSSAPAAPTYTPTPAPNAPSFNTPSIPTFNPPSF